MMGSKSELACHAGTVMAGVEASWRESKHTDAEIRGDNGAAVRCHKMVLAVSPLLSQMIEDDDEDVLLVLPGVGQQELDLLLLLLYTGRADTYNAGLQELLTRCQVSFKLLASFVPFLHVFITGVADGCDCRASIPFQNSNQ